MNKERHVCARRRVGEAAGPDGAVANRTRSPQIEVREHFRIRLN